MPVEVALGCDEAENQSHWRQGDADGRGALGIRRRENPDCRELHGGSSRNPTNEARYAEERTVGHARPEAQYTLRMQTNHQWLIAARPNGLVKETDFRWHDSPVPSPGEGGVLVRSAYLSLEPT